MTGEEETRITNPRVVKAFRAMRHLGIPDEKIKSVLKKLLVLYDKNWELIEEENYRALADAIFDQDESSNNSLDKEPPYKTPCLKSEVNNASSSNNNCCAATMPFPVITKRKQHSAMHESTCDRTVSNRRKTRSQTMSTLYKENEKTSHTPCIEGVEIREEENVSKNIKEVNDISNGKEEVPITIVNGVNNELHFGATTPLSVTNKGKQHSLMHEGAGDRTVPNQRITRSQTMSTLSKENEKPSCNPYKYKKASSVDIKGVEIHGEENVSKNIKEMNDISNGQEEIPITLVNEVNDEYPPSFKYISKNVIFNKAYVNFSMARIGDDNNSCATCHGNCLSSYPPCACAHETRGDFAYTINSLVKEEFINECVSMNHSPEKHNQFYCKDDCPLEKLRNDSDDNQCKGHIVRKFIKECWLKCGCNRQCGNRLVQRGININLQVFMTREVGKGWGVRTLQDLPKGSFVCEYVGEILTNAELDERVSAKRDGEVHTYPVLLDADWGSEGVLKDEEALCLDATHYGNVARFINHRCFDCNLVEIPVEVETPDHHYYHLAFFTMRDVKAMEELTWDYGIDFDDHEHPIKAFRCRCGSKFCRNNTRSTRKKVSRRKAR